VLAVSLALSGEEDIVVTAASNPPEPGKGLALTLALVLDDTIEIAEDRGVTVSRVLDDVDPDTDPEVDKPEVIIAEVDRDVDDAEVDGGDGTAGGISDENT
jgi:hypothetical protein